MSGPSAPDYYRILQVDRGAHPEIIRSAYRTLLRSLGKHPDLGGETTEARRIIEAYTTLSDPERRRAYDRWLKAHSVVPKPNVGLPAGVRQWLHSVLPDYHDAPRAPFARSFDLVLQGPQPFASRLYVKAVGHLTRTQWPTTLVLCRAVRVARSGLRPSADVVLVVADVVQDVDDFLAAARRHAAPWSWNRFLVAVWTLVPRTLQATSRLWLPRMLRRLRTAMVEGPPPPR
jgi:hypothetical protein